MAASFPQAGPSRAAFAIRHRPAKTRGRGNRHPLPWDLETVLPFPGRLLKDGVHLRRVKPRVLAAFPVPVLPLSRRIGPLPPVWEPLGDWAIDPGARDGHRSALRKHTPAVWLSPSSPTRMDFFLFFFFYRDLYRFFSCFLSLFVLA